MEGERGSITQLESARVHAPVPRKCGFKLLSSAPSWRWAESAPLRRSCRSRCGGCTAWSTCIDQRAHRLDEGTCGMRSGREQPQSHAVEEPTVRDSLHVSAYSAGMAACSWSVAIRTTRKPRSGTHTSEPASLARSLGCWHCQLHLVDVEREGVDFTLVGGTIAFLKRPDAFSNAHQRTLNAHQRGARLTAISAALDASTGL